MNTYVQFLKNENITNKVLLEMYNINQDYIQRLEEIKNLHLVICHLVQSDQETTGLESLMQTNIHAINKWLEDLEQWQTMIDQVELQDHLASLACGIYDDYEFYEADALHLENIAVIAIQEAEKLKIILEKNSCFDMVVLMIATIKRQSCQFKVDLCAETDSLSELYPSVFKGV